MTWLGRLLGLTELKRAILASEERIQIKIETVERVQMANLDQLQAAVESFGVKLEELAHQVDNHQASVTAILELVRNISSTDQEAIDAIANRLINLHSNLQTTIDDLNNTSYDVDDATSLDGADDPAAPGGLG